MKRSVPTTPVFTLPRRRFLQTTALAALAPRGWTAPAKVPRTPTALATCNRYEYSTIRTKLAAMFDQIGGVRQLVKNKFVTIKVNLVNSPVHIWSGLPIPMTTVTHPDVAKAVASLLHEYGARQIVFCDQLPFDGDARDDFKRYDYHIEDFQRLTDGKTVFENTRNKGRHGAYDLAKVPYGGLVASAWEVNQSYTRTDVLVSLTKLKSHISGGVTLGMKNLFGVPPSSMYGEDGVDEPNENATGYRGKTMHQSTHKPSTSVDTFLGTTVEDDHGYNVPRFIVDLNAAFPVQLTVIDGISTISTAEGAWMNNMVEVCRPNLLVAGLNPVCTDAAAASAMGFDPDAPDETPPFSNGTNCLRLARELGMGENRLENLDIVGEPLEKVRYTFQPTYQR